MAVGLRAPQPVALLLSDYRLSGEALARALGVADRAVQRVLSGESPPTPDLAGRISQYLGIREELLFFPSRRVGKSYRARACRSCGTEFLPIGPNNVYCGPCRPRPR